MVKKIAKKTKTKAKTPVRKKLTLGKAKIKAGLQVKNLKKEILGAHEIAVSTTKFFTSEPAHPMPRMQDQLPGGYGQDRMVLLVRDSRWVYAYWEITWGTWDNLKYRFGSALNQAKRILRVYEVTNIIFNGSNANRFFDIDIGGDANNWYIDTAGPGQSWVVDIGLLFPDGKFFTILRSNVVHTPLEGPSWILDEEWMIPDDLFARLYGMGFGFGRSSPIGKAWQERVKQALFSGGIASMASPVKKIGKERKFWLVVNTELIVYGATEPDAKVTLAGRPVKLRPDGTFSARFALPDSKQVIPVEATSSDEIETRTITPVVAKETKSQTQVRQLK